MPSKDISYQAVCRKVAELLRHERERQKLSLSTVAARAGLSYQMISYVERGLRIPGLDALLRITSALGVDVAELLRVACVTGITANQARARKAGNGACGKARTS